VAVHSNYDDVEDIKPNIDAYGQIVDQPVKRGRGRPRGTVLDGHYRKKKELCECNDQGTCYICQEINPKIAKILGKCKCELKAGIHITCKECIKSQRKTVEGLRPKGARCTCSYCQVQHGKYIMNGKVMYNPMMLRSVNSKKRGNYKVKIHICELCSPPGALPKTFVRTSHLGYHMKGKHSITSVFNMEDCIKCPEPGCETGFIRGDCFTQHMYTVHKKTNYMCTCLKIFKTESQFNRHKLLCGKTILVESKPSIMEKLFKDA
jgi:hypothetical protein